MRKYKNIRLRKSPIIEERVKLINRIIKETINESFESVINTDYELIEENSNILIYRFKTNSGYSYDLEFITDFIENDKKFYNGKILKDYIDSDYIEPTIDIAFVPSEVNMEDRDSPELYTKETNRYETIELMGRISFLIEEFIKNNPRVKVYIIGKNTKEIKLSIYLKIFDNIFSDNFYKTEGRSLGYPSGAFYFIKKQ